MTSRNKAGLPGALVAVGLGLFVARKALAYVEVRGDSMRPALSEGDRLLAVRMPAALMPRGGFVVGRMPREAAPAVLEPAREHIRDQYVQGKQFVKVLRGKPGDCLKGDDGAPFELRPHRYWVEPLDPAAAGSRQWGPVHRDLIWGWAPLRGRIRIMAATLAARGPRPQDEQRITGGPSKGGT